MRNVVIICICIFSLAITGCDNDIDLLGDTTEIPIVYGLINLSDTATYIRVEKSFSDPDISPSDLAQDPSQLYFDNIQVVLYDSKNRSMRYPLTRVDGNKEGYERSEGLFAQAPNYLYKILNDSLDFNNNTEVVLEVIDTDADTVLASANTVVLDDIEITRPQPTSAGRLRLMPQSKLGIGIRSNPNQSRISYYISGFKYIVQEYDKDTRKLLRTDRNQIYTNQVTSAYDLEFPSILLYRQLSETLEEDPTVYRHIDSIYFTVDCYGLEMKEYTDIQLLNSGITSSSIIPVYNNIENGQGLFSSASSDANGPFQLSFVTIDSLNKYKDTEGLNFRTN